jgi:phage-related protein
LRARADGNIGRALYVTVTGRRLIIVLCAIKKTQATPKRWIDLAEARAREFDRGGLT